MPYTWALLSWWFTKRRIINSTYLYLYLLLIHTWGSLNLRLPTTASKMKIPVYRARWRHEWLAKTTRTCWSEVDRGPSTSWTKDPELELWRSSCRRCFDGESAAATRRPPACRWPVMRRLQLEMHDEIFHFEIFKNFMKILKYFKNHFWNISWNF